MDDAAGARLTRGALLSFERLHRITLPGLRPAFRLWHYPAWGPWRTWILFVPRPFLDHPPVVRRSSWDRTGDLRRLEQSLRRRSDVEPTLEAAEAALEPKTVDDLLRAAAALRLPPTLNPFVCHEVPEFGLEGYARHPRSWIVWPESPSAEHRPVALWAARARRMFQAALGGQEDLVLAL